MYIFNFSIDTVSLFNILIILINIYDFIFNRSYWSTEPNSTLGFLVMDNITAIDEGVYKCEITYTKVHEGCNIVQFINLTTYSKSE